MTTYLFVFEQKGVSRNLVILEKRIHDCEGHPLNDIVDAVDVGYELAEIRGWYLIRVEEL